MSIFCKKTTDSVKSTPHSIYSNVFCSLDQDPYQTNNCTTSLGWSDKYYKGEHLSH